MRSSPRRSTCDHPANALLSWHVNGSLEGAEEISVLEHLDACATCRREVEILAGFARGAREHGVPVLTQGPAETGRSSRRLAYGLAAGLFVPAALGLYWVSLGLPRGAPTEPTAIMLDLGGGPGRGTQSAPALSLSERSQWVTILFRYDADPAARYDVELAGPQGPALYRLQDLPPGNPVGARGFTLPASLLASPGQYELVVNEWGPDPSPRRFRFPFTVSSQTAQ